MARGSQQATTAATSAQNLSNQLQGNASTTYNALLPELEQEIHNPQGFNPTDEARMQTAAQQTAGGANAGAVGQGALLAARTKNPGAPAAAIGQSARNAGEELSKNSLGIKLASARQKFGQRQAGLEALGGLNRTETGGGIQALGEVAPAVNADVNAKNASWDWAKFILDPAMEAAGRGAIAFA